MTKVCTPNFTLVAMGFKSSMQATVNNECTCSKKNHGCLIKGSYQQQLGHSYTTSLTSTPDLYCLNTILVQLYNATASPASSLCSAVLLAIKDEVKWYRRIILVTHRSDHDKVKGQFLVSSSCLILNYFFSERYFHQIELT